MLRTALKGSADGGSMVTLEEDRIMRAAFGRYGGRAADRAAAAAVVARYQQLGGGHWFLCDCRRGAAARPPALVPVSQTHIRRHEDQRWPAHGEACDFHRDPDEQRAITASYARPMADRPLRLARRLGLTSEASEARTVSVSRHNARPGLARLLVQLASDAGLQVMGPGWRPPPLVDQVKAIWAAARAVELDRGAPLPAYFCTSPRRLGELSARIEAAAPGAFPATRPHGVLLLRVAAVAEGVLHPISGPPIAVRGRLAVFGERAGEVRDTRAERSARAPYLAACVVGHAREDGPVEVLSAYAHPCAGEAHLMLVDSDMERRTLAQLRSVQSWLGSKRGLGVSIEKPVHDLGGQDPDGAARPPCIPDFIVRAGKGGVAAVVETMGYADDAYRSRKARMHPAMSSAVGGAPVIAHDFHQPAGLPQGRRDQVFWQAVRWRLAASGIAGAASRIVGCGEGAAGAQPIVRPSLPNGRLRSIAMARSPDV